MVENSISHLPSPKNDGISDAPMQTSLNDELDRVENRLGKLGLGLNGEVFDIFRDLDDIDARLQVLLEQGHPMKSEQAQFDSICKTIKKDPGLFLREMGGIKELEIERTKIEPDPSRWWWYLDRVLAEKRRAAFKRQAVIVGIVALALGVFVIVYQLFLTPDPKVIAVLDARNNAETQVSKGNFDAAILEIDRGLVKDSGSAELLVFKGVLYDAKGQPELSKPIYAQAEKLVGDQESFYLMRAQFYQTVGMLDASITDMKTLIQANPKSARAYLVLGTSYEKKGDISGGLSAYETASQIGTEVDDTLTVAEARVKLGMLMQSAQMKAEDALVPTAIK
jgi:cytochrome c-type biogenesis protein CcmH/NrfG